MFSMRRLLVAATVAFIGMGSFGSGARAAVISDFNTNADGWTTFQNVGASVVYSSTLGNPGGHIAATDYTSQWAYLQAPGKFLVPAQYGGTLSFDLEHFNGNPGSYPTVYKVRVGLQGAGFTLINESTFPTANWLNYSFTLNELSGWRKFSDLNQNYSIGAPTPTQSEMQSVLDHLTRLVIATDYSDGTINDNGAVDRTSLDNVRLSTSEVPLPAALPLFATILAGGGLIAWRRKRKAAKLAA